MMKKNINLTNIGSVLFEYFLMLGPRGIWLKSCPDMFHILMPRHTQKEVLYKVTKLFSTVETYHSDSTNQSVYLFIPFCLPIFLWSIVHLKELDVGKVIFTLPFLLHLLINSHTRRTLQIFGSFFYSQPLKPPY